MTENEKSTTSETPTLHGEMTEEIEKNTANQNADSHSSNSAPASVHSKSKEDEMSEDDVAMEKEEATAIQATRTKSEPEYISGWKLYSLLAAQTLVFFLVMIDMSIVATVSFYFVAAFKWFADGDRLRRISRVPFTL